MKENTYDTQNQTSTLSTIAKTVGLIGLAYLAYQNRSKLNHGWNSVKEGTSKIVQNSTDSLKQTGNKFQDFVQDKSQDATEAISNLSTELEYKYHKLQGNAQSTYIKQLSILRDKITKLISNNHQKESQLGNQFNDNKIMGVNSPTTSSSSQDIGGQTHSTLSSQNKSPGINH